MLRQVLAIFVSLAAFSAPLAQAAAPPPVEKLAGDVNVRQLAPDVWLHSSYQDFAGTPVVSNGLVVLSEKNILMVDSAWNDAQTTAILDWAQRHFGRPVTQAVFTHYHRDKMGGIAALKARGVATYAQALTNELAKANGLGEASHILDLTHGPAQLADGGADIFFPGAGHTVDNIIVYIKGDHMLFGGCLIRPGGSAGLGNTADAALPDWAPTVMRLAARYPEAEIVIPSHGPPGDAELLAHTAELAGRP